MAKIVGALEESGLVRHDPDPEDGRRQLVTRTDLGKERRAGDKRACEQWLARALQQHGSEGQLRAVIEAMTLLDEVARS